MKKPKQKASPELLKQIAAEHRRNSRWWGRELHDAAWAAAYEEAARRVEGAPLKIVWRRVWGEFKDPHGLPFPFPLTKWDWERWQRRIAALVRWQRRIAALVRAELKRGGR